MKWEKKEKQSSDRATYFFAELEKSGAKFQRCGMPAPGEPFSGPGMSTPRSIIDGILGLESTEPDLKQEPANLRELNGEGSRLALRSQVSEVTDELATRIDILERKVALLPFSEVDRLNRDVDKLRGQVERLQDSQNRLKRVKSAPILKGQHFKERAFPFYRRI